MIILKFSYILRNDNAGVRQPETALGVAKEIKLKKKSILPKGTYAAPVLHEREHSEQGVQVPLREY